MTLTRLLLIGAFAGIVAWGAYRHFDPYSAKLPLDSVDLSGIQDKLGQLPPDEQELVRDYVHRTGGHSDSPSIAIADQLAAMPDLKEAIARQKVWRSKEAKLNAAIDAEYAAYNARFDALRNVLQIELVHTRPSGPKPYTFSFKNTSPETVEAFEARVLVRQKHLKFDDAGGPRHVLVAFAYPLAPNRLTFLPAGYTRPVLIPYASVEIDAPPLRVGEAQLGKAQDGLLVVETYPTYIRFAGGRELRIPDETLEQVPDAGAIFGRLLKEE